MAPVPVDQRVYTAEEVAEHCTEEDLWVTIGGKVYDLTRFLRHHPGGALAVVNVAGQDASGPFFGYHPPDIIEQRLPCLQVGVLKPPAPPAGAKAAPQLTLQEDLHAVQEQLRAEGMFETDMRFYYGHFAWLASLFLVSLSLLAIAARVGEPTWLYVASACVLGLFWQQLAFIGHDFGHNSVFHGVNNLDALGGAVVTCLFGVSGQWWRSNHNVHHVVTNSIEHDPDIQHLPVLAISDEQFEGYWSTYYKKVFQLDAVARYVVPYQHYLYIPVMGVARFNLYVQSMLLVFDPSRPVRQRGLEIASIVAFWAWFSALMYAAMPSVGVAVLFLLVSHAVAGITHVQITLSHFAMPAHHGSGYEVGDDSAYARTQFETTLNVNCSPWMDWFHGGLQFQLEHHLMPRLPRQNLRYAREKYIEPLAKRHGVDYRAEPFGIAICIVLRRLADAAAAAREYAGDEKAVNFLAPLINAEG